MSNGVLAVDFGTTNSLAGAWVGKRVEALPLDPSAPDPTLFRTLLYFPNQHSCYYGFEALARYKEFEMEGRLFRSFKAHLPNPRYHGTFVDDRVVTIEDMVGLFLLETKKRAEKHLNVKFNKVVLGRPARYSMDPASENIALHRMKKAAGFAGFDEVRFVPEPLGAAFDYRREVQKSSLVLIGDFGGGTSDFTLIRLRKDGFSKEDVLAVDGCSLAGDAFDSSMMSKSLNRHFGAQAEYRFPMSKNILKFPPGLIEKLNMPAWIAHLKERDSFAFIQELRKCALKPEDKKHIEQLLVLIEDQQIFPFFEAIEGAKRKLSSDKDAVFEFHYPGIDVKDDIARGQFEQWSKPVYDKIFEALDRTFAAAGVRYGEVDRICLTGGTAYVPAIREEFVRRFGVGKVQDQAAFHSVLSGLIEFSRIWAEKGTILLEEL